MLRTSYAQPQHGAYTCNQLHSELYLPSSLILSLVQLAPHQAQGKGQATTRCQDGSLHLLQCSLHISMQPCALPEELAGRRFIQNIHFGMMHLLIHLHMQCNLRHLQNTVTLCSSAHQITIHTAIKRVHCPAIAQHDNTCCRVCSGTAGSWCLRIWSRMSVQCLLQCREVHATFRWSP
jgi:hypothetical protein